MTSMYSDAILAACGRVEHARARLKLNIVLYLGTSSRARGRTHHNISISDFTMSVGLLRAATS
jgi:hypothetical protein